MRRIVSLSSSRSRSGPPDRPRRSSSFIAGPFRRTARTHATLQNGATRRQRGRYNARHPETGPGQRSDVTPDETHAAAGDAVRAIRTEGLTRRFGDLVAVDRLDLEVPRGCFFGFLGPNGAGKSTTIAMLTGLLRPSAGRAEILGRDLAREPLAVKRSLGVVPEQLALFDRLTGPEYLAFVARMYGVPRREVRTRAAELLALMDLDGAPRKLIVDYSHGMKKKIALAAALIHRPEVLFLDEPFEGIDAVASREIKDLMLQLVARGVTIFLTSHVLEIVERLCTDVAIIARGRLVASGPMDEIRRGGGLEEAFLDLVGRPETPGAGLSWLG
ncbi:MAG: ABC transporter ATP-binding protein [Acidobacteria bacterium]|nr:MAG: ABC transporter ATP-binding protein [Acidobacteriota bacterium]